jgi:hypothetical protein
LGLGAEELALSCGWDNEAHTRREVDDKRGARQDLETAHWTVPAMYKSLQQFGSRCSRRASTAVRGGRPWS